MSTNKVNIDVKLKDGVSAPTAKAEKGLKKFKTTLGGVKASALSLGGVLGGIGLGIFAKKSIEAANEQENAIIQLDSALANIGVTNSEVSQRAQEYASALQKVTLYGDESIISAQAMLVAQAKLTDDGLNRATEATLDLASRMGMDLKTASDLVGKTLGSSTNALSRYGITVDGAVGSTERLDSMVDAISEKFGGSAQAEAQSFGGKLKQLQNSFGDLQEELGMFVTQNDGANGFIGFLNRATTATTEFIKNIRTNDDKTILISDEQIQKEIELLKKEKEEYKKMLDDAGFMYSLYIKKENAVHQAGVSARLQELTQELEERQTLKSEAQEAQNQAETEKLTALNEEKLTIQSEFNEEFYNLEIQKIEASDELDAVKLKKKIDLLKKIQKEEKIDDQKRKELQTKQAKFENKLNEEKATIAMDALRRVSIFQNSESKELRIIGQAAASAMAVINTAEAITKALAVLGPIAGPIAATAIGAAGAAQVATINGVKFHGGRDPNTGVDSEIPAMIQQSETVLTAQDRSSMISGINQLGEQVAQLSNQINQGGGGGNINITLEIDGEAIAQAVVPYLDGATAQMERGT
jgi:hypothetical protein